MRVLIAAGGTAGHVVPALSVAAELRAEGCEVHFAGGDRAEASLVPQAGYRFHQIKARGLSRTSLFDAFRAALLVPAAVIAAVRIIREVQPGAVMGGGGYIAGVVGLAAVLTRTPLVLTEADSHLGLSNRWLGRFAKRVCLAFPIDGKEHPRWIVTGRPVPTPFTDREAARRRFGIPDSARCVLVTGGSLGARSINEAAIEAFARADFDVLHLAGERDLPDLEAPRGGYRLEGYVDDFGEAVLACDLAVARAGGSVFELAAQGCPAVLVPYPHAAGDHQRGNAEWMRKAGAAVVIEDGDLTPALLAETVAGIIDDPERLERMRSASSSLALPDAAASVASEILAVGGVGSRG
jgi:UDP-N-acetylglucosamine--N-acetylmuramyl-(pentapeptide) pyrophosphoryl-undecaprenol N-acetylglucosamine transferase